MENIPLPQSLEYVVISCGTNNLDTDDSEKIADGLFCIALALKKRINHLKIVRNGILPRDEQNTARRQKLFIVNELLESQCTNYVNTDNHYLSLMGTRFVKMAASTYLYFIRTNYILLRRDTINSNCLSKEKSVISKKKLLTQNHREKTKTIF